MTNEEFYSALLDRLGFNDGAEVDYGGMCDKRLGA